MPSITNRRIGDGSLAVRRVASLLTLSIIAAAFYVAVYRFFLRSNNSREVIIFSTIGRFAFDDHLVAIDPDGRRLRLPIPARGRSSMLSISANSLDEDYVIKVHSAEARGQTRDTLCLFHPRNRAFEPLPVSAGHEGHGVIAPSGAYVAYALASIQFPARYELWVSDLRNHATRRITEITDNAWDTAPAWRPDEREIVFIRMRVTPRGLSSTLMSVDPSGGSVAEISPADEGVVGAAFGAGTTRLALLSRNGVEILDLATKDRVTLLKIDQLGGRAFRVGGICWSRTLDEIAVSVFDPKSWRSELWVVSRGGGGEPRSLYAIKNATIERPGFVRR